MISITAVYPNRPGSRFDGGYYCGSHSALARRLLAPHGLVGLGIMLGEAALDGGPPPFWAVSEMRFASRAGFETAMAACGAALFADSANYTDVEPILQFGRSIPSPLASVEP